MSQLKKYYILLSFINYSTGYFSNSTGSSVTNVGSPRSLPTSDHTYVTSTPTFFLGKWQHASIQAKPFSTIYVYYLCNYDQGWSICHSRQPLVGVVSLYFMLITTLHNSRIFEYNHNINKQCSSITFIFHNFLMDNNSKFDLQVILYIASWVCGVNPLTFEALCFVSTTSGGWSKELHPTCLKLHIIIHIHNNITYELQCYAKYSTNNVSPIEHCYERGCGL